jgi:hypothetical protein
MSTTVAAEIAFSVEGKMVPMPRAKPNRHGELRIPSDHPVHEQRKRIRSAARAAGAIPVPEVAFEIDCVIYDDADSGSVGAALRVLADALEGVAFGAAEQLVRCAVSRERQKEGEFPRFTVLIKRSEKNV